MMYWTSTRSTTKLASKKNYNSRLKAAERDCKKITMLRQHLSNKMEFDTSCLESVKVYKCYFVPTIQDAVGDIDKKENMKGHLIMSGVIAFYLFSSHSSFSGVHAVCLSASALNV